MIRLGRWLGFGWTAAVGVALVAAWMPAAAEEVPLAAASATTLTAAEMTPVPEQPPAETAAAAEPAAPAVQPPLELMIFSEITSATKFSQPLQVAPSTVSVVTRKQIDEFGWETLEDVLFSQPGFFPSQDYDRRTVGMRGQFEGWNNNHLLLLIDGVPANDNLYGTAYTWEITPLTFVKSIEIIRGPGSALYGSNAMNGVVAINTVSPREAGTAGEIRGQAGSRGTFRQEALGTIRDPQASLAVGYHSVGTAGDEYESADGSGRRDAAGGPALYRTNDRRRSDSVFARLEGAGAWRGLDVLLQRQAWSFGTGHGWLWWIPDASESMQEGRLLATASYRPDAIGDFSQEFTASYQRHEIDWNMRLLPAGGSYGSIYPGGIWETLRTQAEDLFGRAQFSYALPGGAKALAGIEEVLFEYRGDQAHFSNTDVNGGYGPLPGGDWQAAGPWLAWITDQPVWTTGVYAQCASGRLLGPVEATLGLRYDQQAYSFHALDRADAPLEQKTFSQVNPRLGLVATASDDLSFKALYGRAFRAPSPTEIFSANTWSLASNLRELKPEVVTTYEFGPYWRVAPNLLWTTNAYYTRFENQIAYSSANANLSTNLYTQTTAGLETEFTWQAGGASGFVNYTYARRLQEEIADPTIAGSPNELVWAPSHLANAGLVWRAEPYLLSVQGHYQGAVARRTSDLLTSAGDRPAGVEAWFDLDARFAFEAGPNLSLAVKGENLLGSSERLIKTLDAPFDYRRPGRSVFAEAVLKLGAPAAP